MSDSPDGTRPEAPETADASVEELRTQVAVLGEQHERLRSSYIRARQARYSRTALGFALLGLVAAGAGLLLPAASATLFALAGVGLFGALLITFLTPETFIPTDVGRAVFGELARTEAGIVDELALSAERRYLPPSRANGEARLYVPEVADADTPPAAALAGVFVLGEGDEARGVSFAPTGRPLVDDFAGAVAGGIADDPAVLATQLCDALVEQFELVESAEPDLDPATGQLTVAVTESAYGPLDRINHPVTSFLGVGLARGLDATVTVETAYAESRDAHLVTCRWGTEGDD